MTFQRLLFSCTDAHYRIKPSLIKPEVALNGEGLLLDLGLELDFGFLFDLGRTLLLALDPLRNRRIWACRFALRAPVFPLAVRAWGARRAVVFQLAVGAGGALRSLVFQLAVGAGVAVHAAVFHLPVGAALALHAVAF